MEDISTAVGILLALAVFLLLNNLLGFLAALAFQALRRIQPGGGRVQRLLGPAKSGAKKLPLSEDEILGLPELPWTAIYALAGTAGLALFAFLNRDWGWTAWAFWGLPCAVFLGRRYWIHQRRRFMLAQVRGLLVDLRLRLSLYGSLVLSLNDMAETAGSTPIGRALKRHFSGGLPQSGLAVMVEMAQELRSPQLERAVQRLAAAQQAGGALDLDRALDSAIDEISALIHAQAEEQMQKIPLRITLLAMPFLLGPVVVLGFYPLVDRVLKTLSGMPLGGGGF